MIEQGSPACQRGLGRPGEAWRDTEVPFSIDVEEGMLVLHGELDIGSAGTFDAVIDLVGASGGDLVVDLTDLAFIDSVERTRLLELQRRTRAAGGKVGLRRPWPTVARVLALTGLDPVLPVEG